MSIADTIFALSTSIGKAGVAVVRISGTDAKNVFGTIVHKIKPKHKTMQYAEFYAYESNEIIDFGLCVYFQAPNSFTGEDSVELHMHGGLATVRSILSTLSKIKNFRQAEPGEFSRRGFINGKFDLTQAESTIDLIDAETEHQRRAALSHARGTLHKIYQQWWHELTELRAYTEACLDFPDEELPEDLHFHVLNACAALKQKIAEHNETAPQGKRLRLGTKVAIIGPSNAGKSSLLNYLSQSQTAIISPIAGTTRDSLENHISIADYPVKLIDTAGFQETDDPIEQEGIRRTQLQIDQADLVIIMIDGSQVLKNTEKYNNIHKRHRCILVINKQDQGFNNYNNIITNIITNQKTAHISLKESTNLKTLNELLESELQALAGDSHAPLVMHERYDNALKQTLQALENIITMINNAQNRQIDPDLVLIAEELRISLNCIAKIIGKVDVEDLLEIIFSRFCIGK